jgi:hypothetical protein
MIYKVSSNFFLSNHLNETHFLKEKKSDQCHWLGLAFMVTRPKKTGLEILGYPHSLTRTLKNRLIKGLWNPYRDSCILTNFHSWVPNWMVFSVVDEKQNLIENFIEKIESQEDQIRHLRPIELFLAFPLAACESLSDRAASVDLPFLENPLAKWLCSFRTELPEKVRLWIILDQEESALNQFYRDTLSEKWQFEKAMRYGSLQPLATEDHQA